MCETHKGFPEVQLLISDASNYPHILFHDVWGTQGLSRAPPFNNWCFQLSTHLFPRCVRQKRNFLRSRFWTDASTTAHFFSQCVRQKRTIFRFNLDRCNKSNILWITREERTGSRVCSLKNISLLFTLYGKWWLSMLSVGIFKAKLSQYDTFSVSIGMILYNLHLGCEYVLWWSNLK